jgi:hypothetical protein
MADNLLAAIFSPRKREKGSQTGIRMGGPWL